MIKKKSILATALIVGATSFGNAQDNGNYLPSEGDWAISIDAAPYLRYFGNLIGGNDGNVAPSWNYLTTNQTITGRYFVSDSRAYRGSVRLGFGTIGDKTNVTDRSVTTLPIYPEKPATVENSWKTTNSNVGLAGGIEFRKGTNRLQGFYGGELGIGVSSLKTEFTYGNALNQNATGNVDVDAADDMGMGNVTTDPYGNASRVLSTKNGTTLGFGLRGFIGAEYFIRQKISIAGEFGWGVVYNTGGTQTEIMESEDVTGTLAGTFETETKNGSGFGIDTDAINSVFGPVAQLKLSFFISDKHPGGKFQKSGMNDLLGTEGAMLNGNSGEGDSDRDGVSNDDEVAAGTDPKNPDTDGDGLNDGKEINGGTGTDPLKADTDNDGLNDGIEVNGAAGTNPLKADSDGDGLNDGEEVLGVNSASTPLSPSGKSDPLNSCDPLQKGDDCDADNDGLSNATEKSNGTDPNNADTDGDSVKDGSDDCPMQAGTDSKGCPETKVTADDTDGDGLKNADETAAGTDPNNPDTDGDKVMDGADHCPLTPGKIDLHGCALSDEELATIKAASEHIYFNSGSATIKSESFADLDKLAAILKKHEEVKATIEGHTDSSGGADANKRLSQSRADAVKKYLTDKGVKADHLSSIGYGEERPIADNSTAAGRTKNRRVIVKTSMFSE